MKTIKDFLFHIAAETIALLLTIVLIPLSLVVWLLGHDRDDPMSAVFDSTVSDEEP